MLSKVNFLWKIAFLSVKITVLVMVLIFILVLNLVELYFLVQTLLKFTEHVRAVRGDSYIQGRCLTLPRFFIPAKKE